MGTSGGPGLTCAGVVDAACCVCHGSSCLVWCRARPILGLKGLHAERQERGVHGSMHGCIAMLDPMGQCCPEVCAACTDPALPCLAPCAFPCALFHHPDRALCSSTPSSTPYSRHSRWVLLGAAGLAVILGQAVGPLSEKLTSQHFARECWGP